MRFRLSKLAAIASIGALAAGLWLWVGVGFVNYDTLYALVWGQQLGRFQLPDYSLALAPTPHPLAELLGLILSPLGAPGSEQAIVVLAYIALAGLAYVIFRLGQEWFSAPVGLLAAALILTREPVLSYGIRGYLDIPYVAIALGALLVETRRRFSGAPVLWLLTLAGLLRPEAWLLALIYWLYLARAHEFDELLRLAGIVAAAPVIWVLSDLLVSGNPLWSLTQTRSSAVALHRSTGLQNVPVTGAHRLGEILRPDVLIAAAIGLAMSLWLLRERACLGIGACLIALAALVLLAFAGLPIDTRYVLLPASLLAIFAAAGVLGWVSLPPAHRFRRGWQTLGALAAIVIVAFIPSQRARIDHAFRALGSQQRVEHAIIALVGTHAITAGRCGPVEVSSHRQIPQLALLLHLSPGDVIDRQPRGSDRGTYLRPVGAGDTQAYVLERSEAPGAGAPVPAGFALAAHDASWDVYRHCE